MTEKSVSSGGLQLAGIEHLEEIGHGGFASVLRGWQPAFQRWVAVKIVDGSASGRFRKETPTRPSIPEPRRRGPPGPAAGRAAWQPQPPRR